MRNPMPYPLLALALLLTACATPAQRITTKLTDYGVPPRQAQCMGEGLASRLTNDQMRRLADLVTANKDRIGKMSVNDVARQLNQAGDPQLVSTVLRVGLSCAV